MRQGDKVLGLACLLTLLHYTGAYMRVPVLPLYATAHGATPTQVGLVMGAHMVVAAISAIPFGLASDRWGRRTLLLGGMALSALTSLLLPLVSLPPGLMVIYGAAGLGVAAFTPSVMSLVGDVAAPGAMARAYGWGPLGGFAGVGVGASPGGGARLRLVHDGALRGIRARTDPGRLRRPGLERARRLRRRRDHHRGGAGRRRNAAAGRDWSRPVGTARGFRPSPPEPARLGRVDRDGERAPPLGRDPDPLPAPRAGAARS